MVNLKKYFPHAKVGPEQRIYDAVKVGEGKYKKVQEQSIDFAGHVKVPGYDTDLAVTLKVLDDSKCTIGFPDPVNATYKAGPKKLVITIPKEPKEAALTIYEGKGGTYIEGIPQVKFGTPWIGE